MSVSVYRAQEKESPMDRLLKLASLGVMVGQMGGTAGKEIPSVGVEQPSGLPNAQAMSDKLGEQGQEFMNDPMNRRFYGMTQSLPQLQKPGMLRR